jgi:hypothetical protein
MSTLFHGHLDGSTLVFTSFRDLDFQLLVNAEILFCQNKESMIHVEFVFLFSVENIN